MNSWDKGLILEELGRRQGEEGTMLGELQTAFFYLKKKSVVSVLLT
jgi:hypothetical protein